MRKIRKKKTLISTESIEYFIMFLIMACSFLLLPYLGAILKGILL